MKKNSFFKLLVLMLSFCLIATALFTACGGSKDDDDDDENEKNDDSGNTEEVTFDDIVDNLEPIATEFELFEGDEEGRELLNESFGEEVEQDFDGKIENALTFMYSDSSEILAILAFECKSEKEASALQELVESIDEYDELLDIYFEIVDSILIISTSEDGIEIALGEKEFNADDDGKNDDGSADGENDKAAEGRDDFIDDIGGVSDTFEGAVSEFAYDTAEEAAIAYVSNEVAGNSSVEEVNAVSKGELSSTAINKLNLPDELQEGITSVEEFEVSYSLIEEEANSLADSVNHNIIIKVYVIRYGYDWKYYTPCPVNGETITKSYYDSVFDSEKYENCSFVKESLVALEQNGTKYEMVLTQTIKRDNGKILFEQTITGDQALVGALGGSSYLAAYYDTDVGMYVKTSANGSWFKGSLQGVTVDTLVPFYDQYLDYTYFSKTNFGFALKGENAKKYYKASAITTGGNKQMLENADLELYAEYYVKEGVLSGMRMEYSAEIGTVNGVAYNSTTIGENRLTCTDFGTTVVEKPFD